MFTSIRVRKPLRLFFGLFFLSGVLSLAAKSSPAPDVSTTAGAVHGIKVDSVYAFLGVPYGADTAKRRFRAPEKVQPWTGTRDCTKPGAIAPQPAGTAKNAFRLADLPQSEDCLNLNVWTPALRDGGKRPVFVYFHGGGLDAQSANLIDGAKFSAHGNVVVVGVNHRLGGFGFLYLGDPKSPAAETDGTGNASILDLVLSLEWVRDNIAEFGGDPDCVTIFGESGGAAKCCLLMGTATAKGLFHRVWTTSGGSIQPVKPAWAATLTNRVLTELNLTRERIRELDAVPMEQLAKAFGKKPFGPIADGAIYPQNSGFPEVSPLSAQIPMVVGTTRDEMSSFLVKDPKFADITWESLPHLISGRAPSSGPTIEAIIAEYRRMYPDWSAKDVGYAMVTAGGIWKSILAVTERRATAPEGSPTWSYCLNWPGPGLAAHAIDLALLLNSPAQNWRTNRQPTANQMAALMSASLLAFGRTGDPNVANLPAWPRFDLKTRSTMIFELPPRVEDDPRRGERLLFAAPR
jgi:para-nitrobenzyl esterase